MSESEAPPSSSSPPSRGDGSPRSLEDRILYLERHRERSAKTEQDPLLAFGMAFSLLGGELVQELLKSSAGRWSFVGVVLVLSLIVTRRQKRKAE